MSSVESLLRDYFTSFERVDKGSEGQKFICYNNGGSSFFVKTRSKKISKWYLWGLRKEYLICSVLSSESHYVPSSRLLFENDEYLAVTFDYYSSQFSYFDLYKDPKLLSDFIEKYIDLLRDLHRISEKVSYKLESLRGREQFVGGEFISTSEYMFEDRLNGGCSFYDKFYSEYREILKKANKRARDSYNPDRDVLVHGDIQNPKNSLYMDRNLIVVDWEISGWFDYLYDIAFIEATYIDNPSEYNENIDKKELKKKFNQEFGLTTKEREIITNYKCWPHYLELENLFDMNSIDDKDINIQEERSRKLKIMDKLREEFLGS